MAASIWYPLIGSHVPPPVTFTVNLDESDISYFSQFVSATVFVSTGPGDSTAYAVNGLPSGSGGQFYTNSADLPSNFADLYYRLLAVHEIDHPVFGYVQIETRWPGELGYPRDGQYWNSFSTTEPLPSTPTLESPLNGATNYYLNSDWLLQLMWDDEDEEDISVYTVWFFDPAVGWIAQNDRTRYSILGLYMWLGRTLEYNTTYQWFVRKTIDGVDYDSDVWSFTTTTFKPPAASTQDKGGVDVPTGENSVLTVKRLVICQKNRVFYEDI